MAKYAEGTSVTVANSESEVRRTVERYGGSMVSIGWQDERTQVVGFRFQDRWLRFDLRLPDPLEIMLQVKATPAFRYARERELNIETDRLVQAEWRRRWRVLVLRIKTRLEVVTSDPELLDEELGWHSLLKTGETVGALAQESILSRHPLLPPGPNTR